jgi:hypothetical protein
MTLGLLYFSKVKTHTHTHTRVSDLGALKADFIKLVSVSLVCLAISYGNEKVKNYYRLCKITYGAYYKLWTNKQSKLSHWSL